jgi:hypothetical protein
VGDCLEIIRSCCRVLSTVLCFWKFDKALEGPHMSAMMGNLCDGAARRVVDLSKGYYLDDFEQYLYFLNQIVAGPDER